MDNLKEYFEKLDRKNLILVYFLLFIGVGFVYYNYNYSILNKEIEKYNNKIRSLEKEIKNIGLLPAKLNKIKRKVKKIEKENFSLNEDLKYINISIGSSIILNINEELFLNVLENILKKAILNNIEAFYIINKKKDNFKIYTIDIKGSFKSEYFYDFFNFIKDLESIRKIKRIQVLNLKNDNNNIEFYIKINFWSVL